jgi:hypothetical protein
LYCLVFDLRLLVTPLIFWSLYCLFFDLRLLVTPLIWVTRSRKSKTRQYNDQNTKGVTRSRKWKNRQYNGQNTKGVNRSRTTYGLWLPLWYFGHCIVCSSIYGFWLPLWYFGHCIVCFSTYGFWLPFDIVVKNRQYNDQNTKGVTRSRKSKDRQYNDQNTKGVTISRKSKDRQYNHQNTKDLRLLVTPLVFWSLYCLFFDLRLLVTPLVFSNFSLCDMLFFILLQKLHKNLKLHGSKVFPH